MLSPPKFYLSIFIKKKFMSKSDVLISLIKEVVKNEVKQQVKEEVSRLIKSGAISVNKSNRVPVKENKAVVSKTMQTPNRTVKPSNQRSLSKDPMLNEILNSTTPFTAEQRREGMGLAGMMGGSVLDAIQRDSEDGWGEVNLSTKNMNYQPTPQVTVESSGNEAVDIVAKALTRDYTELVKRFK